MADPSFRKQCDKAVRKLDAIEKAMRKQALGEAAEAAGEVFVAEAKQQAAGHRRTREQIKHKRRGRGFRKASQLVYVNSRYAHLLEYGHSAPGELVKPTRQKALLTGPGMFAASSRGGAARGRPFMRPAFDLSQAEMGRVIAVTVRRVVNEAKRTA